MLDLSGSDIANISSSYPANDSILSTNFSPYMEEEELPELLEQQTHQQYQQQPHFNNNSNICFNNQQQNGNNKHNLTNRQTSSNSQQQQLQSILKKNADVWKQGNISNSQTQVLRNINQQFSSKELLGQHRSPKQQHQSRFYETHVQHNRQQPFFLSKIENAQFIDEERNSSSPINNFSAMAPLRTSTPKANLETQYRLPLHIATSAFDADGYGGATSSAPSSPASSFQHLPAYQATIAHDLAQLKKTPSRGGAVIPTKTQPYTSIASLSSSARGAFNTNINRQQHVISPEPRMLIQNHQINGSRQLANDTMLRSSNLQSRAYFHQNIGEVLFLPKMILVTATRLIPYRSRGGTTPSFSQQQNGSLSHLTHGGGSVAGSTLVLTEFASVRRRRLEADIGGARSPVMPSAHLVRSVSPPMHFPASKTTPIGGNIQSNSFSYSSVNNLASASPSSQLLMRNYSNPLSTNYNKIIEETPDNNIQDNQQKPSISSKHTYLEENELDEAIPKTSINKINKLNNKTNKTTYNSISADFVKQKNNNNIQTKQVSFMRNFGTQTMFATKQPVLKDVGVATDSKTNLPKKIRLKEASTSPESIIPPTSKFKELPFSSFIKFNSIGVDTTEIEELEEEIKNSFKKPPPQPPPKPSRPDLEEELRRRRQAERLASLVTEFQYCLGHEPEHLPCQEPPLFDKIQKVDKSVETINLLIPTISKTTATTSTTDLTFSINVGVGTLQPEMVEKSMETETIRKLQIGVQTEKDEIGLNEIGSQTETDWLEREIDIKLAEAEAERKEKRKRLSIERSTETDDEESPDQFIMITCNKCEQRSSIATDEVFEKIVDETILQVSDVVQQQQNNKQQFSEHSSGEILEVLQEEPELALATSSRNEGNDRGNERRSKFINTSIPNFEEVDIEREKRSYSEPVSVVVQELKDPISAVFEDILPSTIPVVHSLNRNCNELCSVDMTDFVSIFTKDENKEDNKFVELIPKIEETKTFKYYLKTIGSKTKLLSKSSEFPSISLLNEDIVYLNKKEKTQNEQQKHFEQKHSEDSEQQLNEEKHLENTQLLEKQLHEHVNQEQQKQIISEVSQQHLQHQKKHSEQKQLENIQCLEQHFHEHLNSEQQNVKQTSLEMSQQHLEQEKHSEHSQLTQEKHLENTQHLQQKQSEQTNQQQIQKHVVSSSPMSSDEGLAEEEEEMFDEFGGQEIDLQLPLDIDADRFSIDTDVQTVIYVEQDGGISGYPQTRSSSSASTKTPNTIIGDNSTTNTANIAAAAAAAAATARTDALRKLLTEPPRNSAATSSFFQRAADSNRSYRTDKSRAQQLQLEYIADRHKSTDAHNICSEPSTPTTSQTVLGEQETTRQLKIKFFFNFPFNFFRKALKETINLKKNVVSSSSSTPSTSTSPQTQFLQEFHVQKLLVILQM
uniref:Uncharacterized protein n=1 Tax=Meloidogyne enterolobii TaxID=390850 RepID=A0A6V7UF77_MELEN|nr:unnamed protein product [Meloidogyne enterolobii]